MVNDSAASPQSEETSSSAAQVPADFCPVCSARLESHRCKLVCPRCGYFMSCSEFE
jgi:hypothetical protein